MCTHTDINIPKRYLKNCEIEKLADKFNMIVIPKSIADTEKRINFAADF